MDMGAGWKTPGFRALTKLARSKSPSISPSQTPSSVKAKENVKLCTFEDHIWNVFAREKFTLWSENGNFTGEKFHAIKVQNTRQDTIDFIFMEKKLCADKPQFADFVVIFSLQYMFVYGNFVDCYCKSILIMCMARGGCIMMQHTFHVRMVSAAPWPAIYSPWYMPGTCILLTDVLLAIIQSSCPVGNKKSCMVRNFMGFCLTSTGIEVLMTDRLEGRNHRLASSYMDGWLTMLITWRWKTANWNQLTWIRE